MRLSPLDVRRLQLRRSRHRPVQPGRKINEGAFAATGEHLVLLNDDVEVISPDWVESMLEFSQWDDVGAVGPQLLFPNDLQQHNGVNLLQGNPGHPFYQFPADHPGYFFSVGVVHRNWSAVTGRLPNDAGRKSTNEVGGFSEIVPAELQRRRLLPEGDRAAGRLRIV